jgi:hypothetical protein
MSITASFRVPLQWPKSLTEAVQVHDRPQRLSTAKKSHKIIPRWLKLEFRLEIREYCRGDPLRSPRDTIYPQNLVLASTTSYGR